MVFIPPPYELMERKGSKGAQIEVSYLGFPDDARQAFQHAVNIWSSLISSDVKIRVRAFWTTMSDPNVLGSASATSLFAGSAINAPVPDVYYQAALAEKIAGKELNADTDFEITVRFNSAIKWFFGLAGGTPSDSYDLVTVVLHELCHGLGFADSFDATATTGSYGFNGIPVIYDTFVEDVNGRRLTNKQYFPNPSPDLRAAITSGSLYFNAPVTLINRAGVKPLLYAPGVFDGGSSISHLSETSTQQVDALMTPFIGRGETIHNPGLLTLSMLADLGWIHTRISHTPPGDTEQNLTGVDLVAAIKSDTILKKNGFKLVYRYGTSGAYDTVSLSLQGREGNISHRLPIPGYNTFVSYYFTAIDTFARAYSYPPGGQLAPLTFFVGADTVRPLIEHNPYPFILSAADTIRFDARINDNLYPVSAILEYSLNNGSVTEVQLEHIGEGKFTGYLLTDDLNLSGSDTLSYRILATDQASSPNTAILPLNGFFKTPVELLFDPVEYYFTAFNQGNGDFIVDGFNVEQPSGFFNSALHSIHPYRSPEIPDKSFEYQAILKYPVIVDESGLMISFKEIVLVEPGEPGALFGTGEFYDYVVVEATRDGGKTWFPLDDGYDSSDNNLWLTTYNSLIVDNNSTARGFPSMFSKRTINLTVPGILSENDVLVIRFRLWSDPFANGWGWAIDDLFIKGLATRVENTATSTLMLFPNPGNGVINVSGISPHLNIESVIVSDASGRIVKRITGKEVLQSGVDISSYKPGIYTITVNLGQQRYNFRYILLGN